MAGTTGSLVAIVTTDTLVYCTSRSWYQRMVTMGPPLNWGRRTRGRGTGRGWGTHGARGRTHGTRRVWSRGQTHGTRRTSKRWAWAIPWPAVGMNTLNITQSHTHVYCTCTIPVSWGWWFGWHGWVRRYMGGASHVTYISE